MFSQVAQEVWFREVKAESFEGDFELMVVDVLVLVYIEEIELRDKFPSVLISYDSLRLLILVGARELTASFISALCSSVKVVTGDAAC